MDSCHLSMLVKKGDKQIDFQKQTNNSLVCLSTGQSKFKQEKVLKEIRFTHALQPPCKKRGRNKKLLICILLSKKFSHVKYSSCEGVKPLSKKKVGIILNYI